ncbi:hypothetical protein BJV78DRAFT_1152638 [Lactifluus subvellereus]|nr:hypothetical protein BJV78DRAFT_1152638 [Lactifluus subvellereus]
MPRRPKVYGYGSRYPWRREVQQPAGRLRVLVLISVGWCASASGILKLCSMFRPTPSPSFSLHEQSSSLSLTEDSQKQFGAHGTGTHKVHYQPHQQWDFVADADERPVDVALVLPHYPELTSSLRLQSSRTPFFVSVHSSGTAPVTLDLPSDFSGRICLSSSAPKITFSAGFTNNILPRVRFARISKSQHRKVDANGENGFDEVEIHAPGHITLRMWDVAEGAPESLAREAWRKMCRRATSSKGSWAEQQARQAIDWDFLLDD